MSEYAGDWPTHERFEEGLKVRRTVVGEARVRTALESADNLSKPLQELVTSYAWGEIWTRPGLSLKSRSILTVVRHQNIWRSSGRRLAECGPRLGLDFRRRACGVASADVRWSVA